VSGTATSFCITRSFCFSRLHFSEEKLRHTQLPTSPTRKWGCPGRLLSHKKCRQRQEKPCYFHRGKKQKRSKRTKHLILPGGPCSSVREVCLRSPVESWHQPTQAVSVCQGVWPRAPRRSNCGLLRVCAPPTSTFHNTSKASCSPSKGSSWAVVVTQRVRGRSRSAAAPLWVQSFWLPQVSGQGFCGF